MAVSIRLADAWPFQPGTNGYSPAMSRASFNPPCGCVAFSTHLVATMRRERDAVSIRLADAWPFQPLWKPVQAVRTAWFQSALRMRGLFNLWWFAKATPATSRVSIRLADAWPFQRPGRRPAMPPLPPVSIRLADAWPFQPAEGEGAGTGIWFQSALRMRGLFNRLTVGAPWPGQHAVSIRLADAWPFQQRVEGGPNQANGGFNPPCGCVAFSTL